MQVFDEISKKLRPVSECKRVVVDQISEAIIFGWVDIDTECREVKYLTLESCPAYETLLNGKVDIIYSNHIGKYISKKGLSKADLLYHQYFKGHGDFPYHFMKRYEAIESFNIFKGKQKLVIPHENYLLSDYLNYTFGLEFETSRGYIPEDICFRDGLIPLRDGSIVGLEYSTVVLNNKTGVGMLKQQLKSLKKYTDFDKDCSLHIHLGGFPLSADKLFNLYRLCYNLQSDLHHHVPEYTFNTAVYKSSKKDYCKKLPNYRNFNQMYEHLVGRKFFNSFTQPHPKDVKREAKWHIDGRYYYVNFINMFCYNINKTIEFRFLRPTYNFYKITLWLYILNAILIFAEKYDVNEVISLNEVICRVYPKELSDALIDGLTKLRILKSYQEDNSDLIGEKISYEDILFTSEMNI